MFKSLGKSAPAATTLTRMYTAPQNAQAHVFSLFVCNRNAGAATYRVAITNNSTTVANQDYIAYDDAIAANSTERIQDFTLLAGDEIHVYSSNADTSFSAFGEELPIVPNT